MIKRIKKILKLGIFNDYSVNADFNDFARFNLFYGWNGCGKTTLSRLFCMLDKKAIDSSFSECEFEVVLDDDSVVKSSGLAAFGNKIFVFNQHFIEENINWQTQGAKTIVVISAKNIEERDQYYKLKNVVIPAKELLRENAHSAVEQIVKSKENFLTNSARDIKHSYQLIDTADSRYMNYDKTKLKAFIEQNQKKVLDKASMLNNEGLNLLQKKLKPVFKDKIDLPVSVIDGKLFLEHERDIISLLETEVVSEVIERLKANQDINSWVQEGLTIHSLHESASCEFCAQELPLDRVASLKRHFNDEYTKVVAMLAEKEQWLAQLSLNPPCPDSAGIYDEYAHAYTTAVAELRKCEGNLTTVLRHWQDMLAAKRKNVFDGMTLQTSIKDVLSAFDKARQDLAGIIGQHNRKAEKFQEQLGADKARIELHYVASVLQDGAYFDMLQKIKDGQENVRLFDVQLEQLAQQKQALEAKLADVAIAADDFNLQLHKFLGRNDISLVYDLPSKGYKIRRAGENKAAHHLSEGEKTAIAFVYFSIKIKENGNNVADSIIVVDDPISSFDSTYLFNSFAYLKYACEEAKQLFVLTHNFQYFKLVRDWIMGKNKEDKAAKSRTYSIDVQSKDPRQSVINNAHHTLLNHGSEYHFFFRKLYGFRGQQILNLEGAFQVANYARKMLEAFFSFKHPKKRNDFLQLMTAGCNAAGVDDVVVARIYRFINAYSHHKIVEFHDSSADNLLSEGYNITADVLEVMSKADKVHYDELVEMCAY